MVRSPKVCISASTFSCEPWPTASITMTDATPMMMPSSVSPVRSRFSRITRQAERRISGRSASSGSRPRPRSAGRSCAGYPAGAGSPPRPRSGGRSDRSAGASVGASAGTSAGVSAHGLPSLRTGALACWTGASACRTGRLSSATDRSVAGSGRAFPSTGAVASPTIRPSAIEMMRRARAATAGSWVIRISVWPAAASSSSCCITCSPLVESSAPVGSSARITRPPLTSARAIDTRCCWPPESWWGRYCKRSSRPSRESRAAARSCRACSPTPA